MITESEHIGRNLRHIRLLEYFKAELQKKDTKIEELTSELEEYKKSKRKSAKPKEAKLKSMTGKQAVQ